MGMGRPLAGRWAWAAHWLGDGHGSTTGGAAGCLNYDLHRSDDDPGMFFFHETWATADDHRAHLDTQHVRHLLAIAPDLLLEPIRGLKGRRIEE